jgi:tetratricopeptide (TPR) repeat protein
MMFKIVFKRISTGAMPVMLVLAILVSGCQSGGSAAGYPSESNRSLIPAARPVGSADAGAYHYYLMAQLTLNEGNLSEAQWYLEQAIQFDPRSILLKMELSDIHLAQHDFKKALDLVERVLVDQPHHVDALIRAGRIHMQMGDRSSAKAAFEKALAIDSSDPNIFIQLGGIYWNENDPVSAERVFASMALRFPESFAAYYFYGKALAAQGKFDLAEDAFKRSLELEPSLEEPRHELVKIYQSQNRIEQAMQAYQNLLFYHPDNNKAALELAILYHQANQEEPGLRLLIELGRLSEDDSTILAYFFEQYYETQQYELALWVLGGMLQGAAQNSELHYLAGLTYDGLKQPQNALAHLKKVQAHSRFYDNAVVHRALLLHDAGQIDQAIEVIEQALVHDPQHAKYYLYMGAFYEDLQHYEKALAALKQGSAIDEGNARFHFRIGVIHDKMGNRQDAIVAIKQSLQIQPEDAEALNYLGYTYAELGIHLEEAEGLIRRALRIKPQDGYITDSLAWVYYKMGRYQEALEWMIKAVSLAPEDPTILEHMGDVYLKLDQSDKAMKYYRRSLELKDDDRSALEEKIRALQ